MTCPPGSAKASGIADRLAASRPTRPREPSPSAYSPLLRRWGFESAALDLALRQNGLSLAEALGRELAPLSYVVSLGLGSASPENELYQAVAQVIEESNLEQGIPQLRSAIDKYAPEEGEFYFQLAEAYWKKGRRLTHTNRCSRAFPFSAPGKSPSGFHPAASSPHR